MTRIRGRSGWRTSQEGRDGTEGDDSDSVEFDAPAPGDYTFLCTFPEHYQGGMKGTLTIE